MTRTHKDLDSSIRDGTMGTDRRASNSDSLDLGTICNRIKLYYLYEYGIELIDTLLLFFFSLLVTLLKCIAFNHTCQMPHYNWL